jgi:solute carrier family 25 phosphate transporter 23/24/25/41
MQTNLSQFFEDAPGSALGPYQRLFCGGIAGITSVTVTYPLDIVRTRLSIQTASFETLKKGANEKPPGMWSVMRNMYKTEGGILALYRGIVPTITGVAPYVGLNFMVYEIMRTHFTQEGSSDPTAIGKLAAGAVSGAVAQTCTYPLDVLRRRFQVNTMSGMGYQYSGIFDAVRMIIKTEGIRGMYKGIAPNLIKVVPSMATSWLSFEIVRDLVTGNRQSGFL